MKTISEKYKQARKDFDWLVENYGVTYDLTGGYVEGDKFMFLLQNPTKKKAFELYVDLIQYGFQHGEVYRYEAGFSGIDVHIDDDPKVGEIYNRWILNEHPNP